MFREMRCDAYKFKSRQHVAKKVEGGSGIIDHLSGFLVQRLIILFCGDSTQASRSFVRSLKKQKMAMARLFRVQEQKGNPFLTFHASFKSPIATGLYTHFHG
jgi:hypothetical protein